MASDKSTINVVVTGSGIRDELLSVISRPKKPDIIIHHFPINSSCSYEFHIKTKDEIWSGEFIPGRIDLVLHMGMRSSYPGYCLETRARKSGYKRNGKDGTPYPVAMIEPERKELISFYLKDANIKVSQNAGEYFCEFEFWSCLASAYLKRQCRDVIFLHVPNDRSAEAIQKGAMVAQGVIQAAVEEIERR
ncbi:pyroglutamyl peptidase type I [Fusarium subglutinans]|uniref:Pyroglutamyl peptidase type I n=1 Tax=Gibberella subglutinans TaxID=42677 RepID=A0A8H5P2W7_GIBSU|nr:pyroglutamyl peptidase type I [Fusarium subglutinans]KAF5587784.1 pyroglutamyl peptidase type I [Fusarium subglutinans]